MGPGCAEPFSGAGVTAIAPLQKMTEGELERHQHRKQHDPDFIAIGSGAAGPPPPVQVGVAEHTGISNTESLVQLSRNEGAQGHCPLNLEGWALMVPPRAPLCRCAGPHRHDAHKQATQAPQVPQAQHQGGLLSAWCRPSAFPTPHIQLSNSYHGDITPPSLFQPNLLSNSANVVTALLGDLATTSRIVETLLRSLSCHSQQRCS